MASLIAGSEALVRLPHCTSRSGFSKAAACHASPQAGICRIWSRIPQTLRIDNFVETLSRDDSLRRWGQRPNEEIHSGKCSGRDGDVRNRPCVRRTSLDKLDAQGLDPEHLCQGELVACTGHQLP